MTCIIRSVLNVDSLQSQEMLLSPGSSTIDISDTENLLGDETKTTNWFIPGMGS